MICGKGVGDKSSFFNCDSNRLDNRQKHIKIKKEEKIVI